MLTRGDGPLPVVGAAARWPAAPFPRAKILQRAIRATGPARAGAGGTRKRAEFLMIFSRAN
jgi:hypothetical protein